MNLWLYICKNYSRKWPSFRTHEHLLYETLLNFLPINVLCRLYCTRNWGNIVDSHTNSSELYKTGSYAMIFSVSVQCSNVYWPRSAWFPHYGGLYLLTGRQKKRKNPFFFKAALSGYFITATRKELKCSYPSFSASRVFWLLISSRP